MSTEENLPDNKDTENDDKVFQIDVREVVHSFKPSLKLPSFVYAYLNRIIHVDKLNQIHREAAEAGGTIENFLETFVRILDFQFTPTGIGYEILKRQQGPFMIVSNHPYGGSEAISFMNDQIKYHSDLKLLAQSFLVYLAPELKKCSVFNRNSVASLLQAVKEKNPLLIYPAGFCSRTLSNKVIFDYEWKSSFVKIAKKNMMPIFVVYTEGHVTNHVLNWTKFRNFFHIKTNVELIYLLDEMVKSGGKPHKMYVSEPINPELLRSDVSVEDWADRIRQYCYLLSKDPSLPFDPELKADYSILPLK